MTTASELIDRMKADAERCNDAMIRDGSNFVSFEEKKRRQQSPTSNRVLRAARSGEPMTSAQLAERAGLPVRMTRCAIARLVDRGDLVEMKNTLTPVNGGKAKLYRLAGGDDER